MSTQVHYSNNPHLSYPVTYHVSISFTFQGISGKGGDRQERQKIGTFSKNFFSILFQDMFSEKYIKLKKMVTLINVLICIDVHVSIYYRGMTNTTTFIDL